jgi:hypothetical protein
METPCSVDIVYIEGLSVTPTYTDYSLLSLLSNRDKSYRMSIQGDTEQTGLCRKCQSEIPLQAERCSECGFEPKVGLISKIFIWISFINGLTFLLISLSSFILIADGFPLTDGLILFGVFGFISLSFFGYIYSKWEIYKQKPAIQPSEKIENTDVDLGEISDEWRESWQEGQERGEAIRERLDQLPSIIWTIGILAGVFFGVVTWILVVHEMTNAVFVALLGSSLVPISIMPDIGRLNRTTNHNFRALAYCLPAAIPLVGWIFGLVWLARKRQKTGSAIK